MRYLVNSSSLFDIEKIYQHELGLSFFPKLGPNFLRVFLETSLAGSHSFLVIAVKGKRAVGFAQVIIDRKRFLLSVIRELNLKNFGVIYKILTSPVILREFWEILKIPVEKNDYPMLLSFAVRREYQRQGIGTRLIKEVKKELKRKGLSYFTVDVWKELKGARMFYEKTGGIFVKEISLKRGKLFYYRYFLK